MIDEEWRPIPEFEGLYEASNTGFIRSVCNRKNTFTGRVLSHYEKNGAITLFKNNMPTYTNVWSLVAAAFLGPRPEGYDIDHIDRNRSNNHVSNLRYCTRQQNQCNRGPSNSKTTSKYKGVSWHSNNLKWRANIEKSFDSEEDAALFYDKIAYATDKTFAYLNFPEQIVSMAKDLVPIILVLNDSYWLPYSLKAINGRFNRIIILDAGSTDGTLEILDWFKNNTKSEILLEKMPFIEPRAQLAYRNAPIAELGNATHYMLLDGDEIWTTQALDLLNKEYYKYFLSGKLYGKVGRIEVCEDLKSAYSPNIWLPHHRLYHRSCTWSGKHPGEESRIPQKSSTEYKFNEKIKVFHFHNTLRSPLEDKVPGRITRKQQKTYHRGEISPIDIFKELPILKTPINNFTVNPILKELQNEQMRKV